MEKWRGSEVRHGERDKRKGEKNIYFIENNQICLFPTLWQLHFLLDRKLSLNISRSDSPSHIYQIIFGPSGGIVLSNYIGNLLRALSGFHITVNMLNMTGFNETEERFIMKQ